MVSPVRTHPKCLAVDGLSGKTKTIRVKRLRSTESLRSVVYSRGKRTEVVSFPSDYALHSRLAVELWNERPLRLKGVCIDGLRKINMEPSRSVRIPLILPTARAIESVEAEFVRFGKDLAAGVSGFELGIAFPDFRKFSLPLRLSAERAMYVPLLGAVVLGMGSALFLEHSLGKGASAGEANVVVVERSALPSVLGAEASASSVDASVASELGNFTAKDESQDRFEKKVREMVKGHPIEDMLPYIFDQDRLVAIFLISIAKKESAWGTRVPLLEGQDCFNYWGYRGQRKMMGTGGHTCFNSRKDAVDTVSKRLKSLIYDSKLDTPKELILWKCGSTCAGHSSYSVGKWISDVDLYYQKLNKEE
jgi:hypothetical protein